MNERQREISQPAPFRSLADYLVRMGWKVDMAKTPELSASGAQMAGALSTNDWNRRSPVTRRRVGHLDVAVP